MFCDEGLVDIETFLETTESLLLESFFEEVGGRGFFLFADLLFFDDFELGLGDSFLILEAAGEVLGKLGPSSHLSLEADLLLQIAVHLLDDLLAHTVSGGVLLAIASVVNLSLDLLESKTFFLFSKLLCLGCKLLSKG